MTVPYSSGEASGEVPYAECVRAFSQGRSHIDVGGTLVPLHLLVPDLTMEQVAVIEVSCMW
jgi:hypothetical protein